MIKTINEITIKLSDHRAELTVEDGRLFCNSPNPLPSELVKEVSMYSNEILAIHMGKIPKQIESTPAGSPDERLPPGEGERLLKLLNEAGVYIKRQTDGKIRYCTFKEVEDMETIVLLTKLFHVDLYKALERMEKPDLRCEQKEKAKRHRRKYKHQRQKANRRRKKDNQWIN